MDINFINELKKDLPLFKEKIEAFENEEINKNEYKGISGYFGSYAQKDPSKHMLRLRMSAGELSKEKLAFITEMIQKHDIKRVHFTTCQAIQLHDLKSEQVIDIMSQSIDRGIITLGGGGDYPRNIMCSPLSGVDPDEYLDVLPYALKAADYLLSLLKGPKLPRKLKLAFCTSDHNETHATFKDIGFIANKKGHFDVYTAGGLGANSRFGTLIKEDVLPEDIIYYIKAMYLTFLHNGNYENRAKARTRYMVEALGGKEAYIEVFNKELEEVLKEDLKIIVEPVVYNKKGDGVLNHPRALKQKQDGLYAVNYHPIAGDVDLNVLIGLNDLIQSMDDVEVRVSPDESIYIINLTASEAQKVIDLTDNTARNVFETSISCIGATTCQVGLRDSNGMLHRLVEATRKEDIKAGALPQINISGCPSSCGTHQVGKIGFRGAIKRVDGVVTPAFALFVNGSITHGKETMGEELGVLTEDDVENFIIELGHTVEASGQVFDDWFASNEDTFKTLAQKYI